MNSDALLLGRVTYEGFAEAWPQRSGDEFSDKFNSMPKYVVSSTLENPEWTNSTVIGGDLGEDVSKLKEQYDKDIVVHGSGQLARGLLDEGLVDEVRLMVFPVVLGSGKRLFDGVGTHGLNLTDSETVGPDGVIVLSYAPAEKEVADQMDQATAEEALKELEPLVGEWTLEAGPPGGPLWPGEGRVSFEWMEGNQHLIERWRIDSPDAPNGTAVIGCDAANGTYSQLYADDRGVCRIYEMSIGDGEWRLWRDGEPFAQRFVGRFSEDGKTIEGRWEIAEDGSTWDVDFDLTYRRVG